jgi:transcriptional regulator GlxA family with amidase domain
VTAALSLALHLVERHAGIEVAALTAKSLAVDKNRDSQAAYLIPKHRIDVGDDLAVRAQRWIEANYAEPTLSLEALAKALGASPRTVQRRFVDATRDTPMGYARLVRIEAAKQLLESSRTSVDEIVALVGYRDVRSFARLFRELTDESPSSYRARFGLR